MALENTMLSASIANPLQKKSDLSGIRNALGKLRGEIRKQVDRYHPVTVTVHPEVYAFLCMNASIQERMFDGKNWVLNIYGVAIVSA
jgi:hypothetical protein